MHLKVVTVGWVTNLVVYKFRYNKHMEATFGDRGPNATKELQEMERSHQRLNQDYVHLCLIERTGLLLDIPIAMSKRRIWCGCDSCNEHSFRLERQLCEGFYDDVVDLLLCAG